MNQCSTRVYKLNLIVFEVLEPFIIKKQKGKHFHFTCFGPLLN
jgi:hypothetical protein